MSQANQYADRKDMRIDEKKNNMCLTAVYNDLCLGLSARARAREIVFPIFFHSNCQNYH